MVDYCQNKNEDLFPITLNEQDQRITLNHEISNSGSELNLNDKSKHEKRQGRWLHAEHFRFIKGCLLYGNNWKQVKECVKTRSSAQIRSHAQKYIIKLCKKYNNSGDSKIGRSSVLASDPFEGNY